MSLDERQIISKYEMSLHQIKDENKLSDNEKKAFQNA